MSKKISKKVYEKQSTLSNAGKGLYAAEDISAKSIISEFKGKLKKPTDEIINTRSLIRFADDYYLECNDNDIASYVNDCIDFPTDKPRRKLYETLESDTPIYKIHKNATLNSYIKLDQKRHKVYLVAITDIKKDQEIFCHYGFTQWFKKEFLHGFLYEERMDTLGFPKFIYSFPAFKSYVNHFYPTCETYQIETYEDKTSQVILVHTDKTQTVIVLEDYAGMMRKTVFKD
jgi:hypothetical protein